MKAQNKAPGVKAPDSVLKGTAGPIVGNNDDLSLNPQGRERSDSGNRRDKLLSCRHHLNVATMNVRTIKKDSKRQELVHNCDKYNVSILGIVDHKIVHGDKEAPVVYHQSYDSYTLITSSAWRKNNNSAQGGVGLLINNKAKNALAEVISWNERILIAHFTEKGKGHPPLTIIVHYSPVEGDENAEEHYEKLAAAIHNIPKHNAFCSL